MNKYLIMIKHVLNTMVLNIIVCPDVPLKDFCALPRSHAHTDQLGHCAVAVSFTCVLLGVTSS